MKFVFHFLHRVTTAQRAAYQFSGLLGDYVIYNFKEKIAACQIFFKLMSCMVVNGYCPVKTFKKRGLVSQNYKIEKKRKKKMNNTYTYSLLDIFTHLFPLIVFCDLITKRLLLHKQSQENALCSTLAKVKTSDKTRLKLAIVMLLLILIARKQLSKSLT